MGCVMELCCGLYGVCYELCNMVMLRSCSLYGGCYELC